MALNLFFLIGLLPGGVYEQDLNEIWGSNWEPIADKLINYSLLQKKEHTKESNDKQKFILPPFMTSYAEAKITEELKTKY